MLFGAAFLTFFLIYDIPVCRREIKQEIWEQKQAQIKRKFEEHLRTRGLSSSEERARRSLDKRASDDDPWRGH